MSLDNLDKKILIPAVVGFLVVITIIAVYFLTGNSSSEDKAKNFKKDQVLVKVDGEEITRGQAASRLSDGGIIQGTALADPPTFEQCIANQRKLQSSQTKVKIEESQLKTLCEQQYNSQINLAVDVLTREAQIKALAEVNDVEISDEEVEKQVESQLETMAKSSKSNPEKVLEDRNMTKEQFEEQVRISLLQQALTNKLQKSVKKKAITNKAIRSYYNKNKDVQFKLPVRRQINRLTFDKKEDANKAVKELEAGKSYQEVAKQFKKNPATTIVVTRLQLTPKALADKVFNADTKKVTLVKAGDKYEVFTVTSKLPSEVVKYSEAKPNIKNILEQQNNNSGSQSLLNKKLKEMKKKTECFEGITISACAKKS